MDKRILRDEILATLNAVLDRWKKIKIKRFIVDKEVEFRSLFISIDLKNVNNIVIRSENGGLLTDSEKTNEFVENWYCVTVGVGDLELSEKANGLGVGYCTNKTSLKLNVLKRNLNKAIDSAFKMALAQYFIHHAEISELLKEEEFQKISKELPVNHCEEEKILKLDFKTVADILEESDGGFSENKKIKYSEAEVDITKENRWFVSFEKMNAEEKRSNIFTSDVYGSVTSAVHTKDEEGKEIKFRDRKKWTGLENFKEIVDLQRNQLEELVGKFYRTSILDSGLYRAVLSPETAYTVFHEGFGAHLSSAKAIDEEGATAFKAKEGQKIFPSMITVIDDPTIEGLFGTYKFDEEGQPAKKVILAEDGVLKNYLYDRISAGRRNTNTNGHARAQYGEIPEPRTANMLIKSKNPLSENELIEMMKNDCRRHNELFGLYINGRSGEVEYESGQFRVFAAEFYKIYPNGRIEPVSGAFIVGDPYMTLNQVKAIGDNYTECVGYCGSESGTIRTGGLCPSIYFRKIEVHSNFEYPETDNLLENEESE